METIDPNHQSGNSTPSNLPVVLGVSAAIIVVLLVLFFN
jgi:hypothetical protein